MQLFDREYVELDNLVEAANGTVDVSQAFSTSSSSPFDIVFCIQTVENSVCIPDPTSDLI